MDPFRITSATKALSMTEERRLLLKVGDVAMHMIHSGLIAFTVFGVYFDSTRPIHLISSAAIAFSWYGLGRIKGPGYCLLTDIHWRMEPSSSPQGSTARHAFRCVKQCSMKFRDPW